MTQVALQHYLAVGAIMFVIGMIGFMTRRNLIVIFLCTELMFQGVAINMIAFGRFWRGLEGQAFVIFILVIAAAEASLALGLVVLLFRQKNTLDADAWRELQGERHYAVGRRAFFPDPPPAAGGRVHRGDVGGAEAAAAVALADLDRRGTE